MTDAGSASDGGHGAGGDLPWSSLESAEHALWAKLGTACRNREAPWRTPAFATTGADGGPSVRILILRAVDPNARALFVHSDARSAKIAEIGAAPCVSLLFYDAADQLQLRASGIATVLRSGDQIDSAWARVPAGARRNYRTLCKPGSPASGRASLIDGDGRQNFAIIRVAIRRFEFLWLGPDRHCRGAICWNADQIERGWLTP